MSHKHPTFLRRARLAPLAAAAALIAATSGVALAQSNQSGPVSVLPLESQISTGTVNASNASNAQYTNFPSNGAVTGNGVDALAIGNQHRLATGATAALTINNQPLMQPTVDIAQQVSGTVSSTTTGMVGVNAANVIGNHDGDTASVSNNEATSTAIGSTAVGTMQITGTAVDMSTPATAAVSQTAAGAVFGTTSLTQVGIHLNQTGGANPANAMDNLGLSVSGNQVDASAQANTTQAGIQVQGSSVNVGADASSTVDQVSTSTVFGISSVGGLLGIRVQGTPNRAMTDSTLSVSGNQVQASAGGNQQTSALQITASGDVVQAPGTVLATTATQGNGGIVLASGSATTLGIDNQKPGSANNSYSVAGNSVSAQADGNSGSNRTAVAAAGSIDGAVLETTNSQTLVSPVVTAGANVLSLGVQTLDSSDDTMSVSGNLVQAQAQGSSASNQTRAGASNIAGSVATTANTQVNAGGAVSAGAGATRIGSSSTSLSGSSLTVSGNQVSADATAASATNDAQLGADNTVTQSAAVVMNTQGHAFGEVEASASSNLVGAATTSASNSTLVVSGNQFSASAASQKADNLARINATNGVVDSGAIVVNVQDHQAGNVGATVADFVNVSPAPQPAPMLIGLRADTASGGSLTVTGNQGASDAIVNQANNQVSMAGSRVDGSSGAVLYNAQNVSSGNAQSLAWVNLGADGNSVADTTRAGGHELVVSNNQFSANASQNQAVNSLEMSAVSTLGTGGLQPALLGSVQTSAGETSATTQMDILSGNSVATDASGNTTITGNQASSMARANVANNQLTLAAGTQASDQLAVLANTQGNTGAVSATTRLLAGGTAANRLDGNITTTGNQASAVAAGNTSLNSVQVGVGTALNSGSGVGLINAQSNSGSIAATATLNADGFTRGSSLNLSGNIASATAVGNNAENVVNVSALPGQQMASAALTSNQVNSGNVSATVSGSFSASGVPGTSGINVSGNRSSAVAIGNRSTSSMTLGVQ
ncbi:hypothetical protein HS961_02220 [Comamonas piscis]|uniref:S-layer family protein n=1 Tax=Comamonas piscis TaxID=1562974 RepID=A0A7G5ECM0_9BURK|nr:hypothetical protein [Comamonas piscis]QMV71745.1 hypothetical protein HS961_02220 [Comamonas piscis]WSO34468.1 hypothetical protein VUJ63_02235 [Comamonas piscis]